MAAGATIVVVPVRAVNGVPLGGEEEVERHAGQVEEAARLLARPHFVRGNVVTGRVERGGIKVGEEVEIVGLAETRTARAFMLLGRVAGTFD